MGILKLAQALGSDRAKGHVMVFYLSGSYTKSIVALPADVPLDPGFGSKEPSD